MRERRGQEVRKLDRMDAYTESPCRRRYIIEYFGETADYERCGTCDACRAGAPLEAEPRLLSSAENAVILKILSCVARMERQTGQAGWGIPLVAQVLTGSKDKNVKTWRFEQLSTYGLLSEAGRRWTVGEVSDVIEVLVGAGFLDEVYKTMRLKGKERTWRTVCVNERSWACLRGEMGRAQARLSSCAKAQAKAEGFRTGITAWRQQFDGDVTRNPTTVG